MAQYNISFKNPINVSVQIGDKAFYSVTSVPGTAAATAVQSQPIVEIGTVIAVEEKSITVDLLTTITPSDIEGNFIMFSKNKSANTSGLLGYYIDVKFSNNSKQKAELFVVGSDVTINS
tara:strand:- start:107 stop:463 length:357 start_codon:yes stop_codon:yes gene_type:complete